MAVRTSSNILRKLFLVELRPEWPYLGAALGTQLFTSATALAVPAVCGKLVDASYGRETELSHFIFTHPVASCSFALGFFAVSGSANLARATLTSVAGERFALRLRSAMIHGAAQRETSYLGGGKLTAGDLQTRIVGDVAVIQKATTSSIKLIRSLLTLTGGIPLLIYISPTLSVASLCLLPPIALAARRFGTSMKTQQALVQKSLSDASSVAGEFANNFKLIRQFGGERAEIERFDSHATAAAARAIETSTMGSLFEFAVDGVAQAAVVSVVAIGLYQVKTGTMTPGNLSTFVMLSLMVANHSWALSSNYTKLMRGAAAAERVFSLSDNNSKEQPFFSNISLPVGRPLLSKDASIVFPSAPPPSAFFNRFVSLSSAITPVPLPVVSHSSKGMLSSDTAEIHLHFEDVHFAYDKISVLTGLNLKIQKKSIVAIVGSSGSGKSTLSALATRLYDPSQGRVLLNAVDVRDQPELRSKISVVDQDHILLQGSILDNLIYANQKANMKHVEEALRIACATDFVETKGLEFQVGAGALSGGQRQRLAVARAMVKVLSIPECKLLFLDEGLSNLDRYTGLKTWENICQLADELGLTVVHVTHQQTGDILDTVDKVVRLEHGRVSDEKEGQRKK